MTRTWPRPHALFVAGMMLAVAGLLASPRLVNTWETGQLVAPFAPGLLLVGSLLIVWATGVFVLAPLRQRDAGRQTYGSHTTIIGMTLLASLGALVATVPAMFVVPALMPPAGSRHPTVLAFLLSSAVLAGALVAVVYWRVVRPRIITWTDMGLVGVRRPWLIWGAGLLGGLALFSVAAVIGLALQALGIQQTQRESMEWLRAVPLWQYAFVAVAGAVLAPMAEEIYFRGYVFRAYWQQKGPLQAYVLSSLLFALVHLNLPAIVPIFVMGLLLAYLYHRTGSVLPGIIAHALNNGLAFAALYFA